MRLIDADALIEFIDVGHLRHPSELVFSELDVVNMLNHAPTIEPQKWIPCSERLPESKGKYLTTYHPCYWGMVEDGLGMDVDTFQGKSSWAKREYHRVIAWMPLPEPYKE